MKKTITALKTLMALSSVVICIAPVFGHYDVSITDLGQVASCVAEPQHDEEPDAIYID